MSRPNIPTYRTLNWPAYNKALKCRGSLSIWFDSSMVWGAKPTSKRGRQPIYSDADLQTCLTMKVLFGMALRQTTCFVENSLHLDGLDWAALVATTPIDFRKGHDGLAALVSSQLRKDPFTSTVFVCRSRRADRLKLLYLDGTGLMFAYKGL